MDEKWRLALWAAAAAKDMEFAATQRSANPFVEEGLTFFDKLNCRPFGPAVSLSKKVTFVWPFSRI